MTLLYLAVYPLFAVENYDLRHCKCFIKQPIKHQLIKQRMQLLFNLKYKFKNKLLTTYCCSNTVNFNLSLLNDIVVDLIAYLRYWNLVSYTWRKVLSLFNESMSIQGETANSTNTFSFVEFITIIYV